MNAIKRAIREISVGQPAVAGNLAVFPLLNEKIEPPTYLTLPEALRAGAAHITEVSESGHVPRLMFVNKGDVPVLLLDGEELVGCKQNRTLNLTILAPAHSELGIPVSCVEQGRWRFESSHFESSNRSMFAELRAAKVAQVSASLDACCQPVSDQGAIWEGIARKSERMGSDSASCAMGGIYRNREALVEDYVRMIRSAHDQVGAVFAINGRVTGLELFDASSTYDKYLEKIASGYALDAIDHFTTVHAAATRSAVEEFLARVAAAVERRFDSVGLGEDVRLTAPGLAAAGLEAENRVVHLCAFDVSRSTQEQRQSRDRRHRGTTPVHGYPPAVE
jgi:hypothetical protein